jgi:hypothetical protein
LGLKIAQPKKGENLHGSFFWSLGSEKFFTKNSFAA